VRNRFFSTRRRIAVVGAGTAIALAGAGAAFAYFTSTGSGTGSGTVGSAANWSVTAAPGTYGPAGALYPCGTNASPCPADEETIVFTVTNNAKGAEELQSAAAVIDSDGSGNIEIGGTNAQPNGPGLTGATPVSGCLAAWFTATDAAFGPVDVPSGGTVPVTVTVAMEDSGTLQNNCQGQNPDVNLNVT
jgi:hypothetical protein